jgi:hypothetical protein
MAADFLWLTLPVRFLTPKKARISQQEKDKAQISASEIATRTTKEERIRVN